MVLLSTDNRYIGPKRSSHAHVRYNKSDRTITYYICPLGVGPRKSTLVRARGAVAETVKLACGVSRDYASFFKCPKVQLLMINAASEIMAAYPAGRIVAGADH